MKKSAKAKKSAKKKPARRGGQSVKSTPYYAQSKRLGFRLIEAGDQSLYTGLFTDAKTLEHFCKPLTAERAKLSYDKAMTKSHQSAWVQRISIVVERAKKKSLGIASIKMVDPVNRIAEVGILLHPSAHAQRYATEASRALITSAFRRYTIAGISAHVAVGHKAGERLVTTLGYDKGAGIPASDDCPERSIWSMSREKWADTYK